MDDLVEEMLKKYDMAVLQDAIKAIMAFHMSAGMMPLKLQMGGAFSIKDRDSRYKFELSIKSECDCNEQENNITMEF